MQIATQRAENIRRAVQELKLKYEEHTLAAITISLGVAAFSGPWHDSGRAPARCGPGSVRRQVSGPRQG